MNSEKLEIEHRSDEKILRIGIEHVRAQTTFFSLYSTRDSGVVNTLALEALTINKAQFMGGELRRFMVFVESHPHLKEKNLSAAFSVGSVAVTGTWHQFDTAFLDLRIRHRKEAMRPENRRPGHVSVNPPEYLKQDILLICIGSPAFLARCVQLHFEIEGLLRDSIFELLNDILDTPIGSPNHIDAAKQCFVHLVIATGEWWPGWIDGTISASKRLTDEGLTKKLGIQRTKKMKS